MAIAEQNQLDKIAELLRSHGSESMRTVMERAQAQAREATALAAAATETAARRGTQAKHLAAGAFAATGLLVAALGGLLFAYRDAIRSICCGPKAKTPSDSDSDSD